MDDVYFYKIFKYPSTVGQYFELYNKRCYIDPKLQHWLDFKERYNFYLTHIKPYRLNPQSEYFQGKVKFKGFQKILSSPMTGLSILGALRTSNKKTYDIVYNRIAKIMQLCADISVNHVSNPILIFDEIQRVHPGKNLVSAHQILNKQLKVIVAVKKSETPKTINNIELKSLKDIANCFENTPVGFIEPGHIHMFCFHKGYENFDSNGYVAQPSYNLDGFLEFLCNYDSKERITVNKSNGNCITVPIIYNTAQLTNIFQEAYNQNFRWEK